MPRKKNKSFDDLSFILIKNDKKYMALCEVCDKYLTNTASSRLQAHRRICKLETPENLSWSSSRSKSQRDSPSLNTSTSYSSARTVEKAIRDIENRDHIDSINNSANIEIIFDEDDEESNTNSFPLVSHSG